MDYNSLSISRIDLTWNIYFDNTIDLAEVIRLFKKSYLKKNYNVVKFNDKRDRYSFRITSIDNSQTITVYDKVYEIRNHKKNADYKYDDLNILRIEISLKRSAFIRIVKQNLSVLDTTFDQVLYYVYAHRYEILRKYFWVIFRCSGRHMPYDKAKSIILNCKYSMEYKERMLYFMDKVSNSDTYFTAMMKTRNKFDISESAINRLEGKFDAIDVNPITFPKDSKIKALDSFHEIFSNYSDDYSELRTIEFYSSLNKKLRLIREMM